MGYAYGEDSPHTALSPLFSSGCPATPAVLFLGSVNSILKDLAQKYKSFIPIYIAPLEQIKRLGLLYLKLGIGQGFLNALPIQLQTQRLQLRQYHTQLFRAYG